MTGVRSGRAAPYLFILIFAVSFVMVKSMTKGDEK